MQRAACQLGTRRGRPLRCSGPPSAGAEGGGAPPLDRLCRICWDVESADSDLVAPCACSGSMVSGWPGCWWRVGSPWAARPSPLAHPSLNHAPSTPPHPQRYVHMQCLQHWQAQLRSTKGLAAARRCDVCKDRWAKCYQPPAVPTDWRTMLRDLFRSVPWPAVLEVRWAGATGNCCAVCALQVVLCTWGPPHAPTTLTRRLHGRGQQLVARLREACLLNLPTVVLEVQRAGHWRAASGCAAWVQTAVRPQLAHASRMTPAAFLQSAGSTAGLGFEFPAPPKHGI